MNNNKFGSADYTSAVPMSSGYNNAPPPPAPPTRYNDERGVRDYLSRSSWPRGLQGALISGLSMTPARFFICDDSGSMMSSDGHRLIGEGNTSKLISCSRWTELTETLKFHVGLAQAANAPTEFRLLNGASPIFIGQDAESDANNVPTLTALLNGSPGGGTPLCYHLKSVMEQIQAIAPQLRDAGKKAALVILTDGEPSDGDIVQIMRPLYQLPVWVVIRLCTDNDQIVDYWNNIDNQIELNMDVIDDPVGEAKEIHAFNNWFTYGEPLHRLREFGMTVKELDLIDEGPLSMEQMMKFINFIFGVTLPQPEIDWNQFSAAVSSHNDQVPMVWNPINGMMSKWIDIKALNQTYGRRGMNKGKSSGGTDLGAACCNIN